jgi:hypothetical protein
VLGGRVSACVLVYPAHATREPLAASRWPNTDTNTNTVSNTHTNTRPFTPASEKRSRTPSA